MKKNILFCSGICTPLHLLNALSYIQSQQKNEYAQIYLHINNYWGHSVLNQKYFEYVKNKQIIISKDAISEFLKNHDTSFNLDLLCIGSTSGNPFFCKKFRKIIVIDEGLSSFTGFSHILRATKAEKGVKAFLKLLTIGSIGRILSKQIKRIVEVQRFSLLLKDKKGYSVNEEYKTNFKKVLESINYTLELKNDEQFLLFCSQPFVKAGILSHKEYFSTVSALDTFAKKNNLKLLIKLHPVEEPIEAYKDYILEYEGAVEEILLREDGIQSVVSFTSTALLINAVVFEKKSYFIDSKKTNLKDSNINLIFKSFCTPIYILD